MHTYQKGQMVITSTGKTGIVEESEYWVVDGTRFSNPMEARQYGWPTYVPYKVKLRSSVAQIGHKKLKPVSHVSMRIKAEDFKRIEHFLESIGVEYNFI